MFSKIFKKQKFIILSLLILISGLFGLWGLGSYYSNRSNYDVVIGTTRKTNLNYATASAGVDVITSSLQETWVSNAVTDISSLKLLQTSEAWGDPSIAEDFLKFNEDAVVYQYDVHSLDDVNKTSTSYSEVPISTMRFSIAEEIWANDDFTEIRFFVRGAESGEEIYWSTGETVKASDFVYGMKSMANKRNGSANEYIYSKYTHIRGFSEWSNYQTEVIASGGKEDFSKLESIFCNLDEKECGAIDSNGDSIYGVIYSNKNSYVQYNLEIKEYKTFLTLLPNTAMAPINEEFMVKNDLEIREIGTSAETLSTYGPLKVDYFDPAYGAEVSKNENYHASEFVHIENGLFRVVEEPVTQVSLFESGYVTSLISGEVSNKKLITENEATSEWIDWQLDSPVTDNINWNLLPTNERKNSVYYKNPNFRKAMYYAFDRTSWIGFAGAERVVPSSLFIPTRMGYYPDATNNPDIQIPLEEWLYNFKYSPVPESERSTSYAEEEIYLNPYSVESRNKILRTEQEDMDKIEYERGVSEATNSSDPNQNKDIALYYWNEFLTDMSDVGISVPSTISIEYPTSSGESDPIPKAMNYSIFQTFGSQVVEIYPKYYPDPFSIFKSGDWDVLRLGWRPDIRDPWGSASTYNAVDTYLSFNITGGWNYWTGSTETFGNTYGNHDVSEWANDGILVIDEEDWDSIFAYDIEDFYYEGETYSIPSDDLQDVWNWFNGANPTKPELYPDITPGTNYDQVNGITTEQLNMLDEYEKLLFFISLETMVRMGAPTIIYSNTIPTISPNRSPFISSSPGEAPSYGFGYDCNTPPKGYPSCEWILKTRN